MRRGRGKAVVDEALGEAFCRSTGQRFLRLPTTITMAPSSGAGCTLQLHRLVGQHPQGPAVSGPRGPSLHATSIRWASPLSSELAVPLGLGMVVQHAVQPLLTVPPFGADDCTRRRVQRHHLEALRPSWPNRTSVGPNEPSASCARSGDPARSANGCPVRINRSRWSGSSDGRPDRIFLAEPWLPHLPPKRFDHQRSQPCSSSSFISQYGV